MTPLKANRLALLGGIFAVLGLVIPLLLEPYRIPAPVLPISGVFSMIAVAVLTFILGWRVHRWKSLGADQKPRRELDPILAARTLVLAQACAYAGTVLAGWHLGIAVEQLQFLAYSSGMERFIASLVMIGGGLLMLAVGLIVERFCKVPPEDKSGNPKSEGSGTEGEYA